MTTKNVVMNALLAALYAALTIALAPLSYGPIQVRLAEFMTLFAFRRPQFIPGLTIGCLLANLYSPFGILDIVIGTLATFVALYAMRWMPNVYLASLCPVIANGVIIGAELAYLGALPPDTGLVATMFYIAAGEFLAVSCFGSIVYHLMKRFHAPLV